MGVSKHRATPRWMIYNLMENPIKMDDLGGTTIFGNIQMFFLGQPRCHVFLSNEVLTKMEYGVSKGGPKVGALLKDG